MKQKPDLDLRTEVPESPIKTKSFFDSVKYAFRGLGYAFRTERNFKLYIAIVIVFFTLNLIIGVSLPGHIAFFICVSGAFAAEMINTAIEHLCNFVSSELHESIRLTKDLAAAAVLLWGFSFFPLEVVLVCVTLLG